MTDAERVALVTEIAEWLRRAARLEEITDVGLPGPAYKLLWDASFALQREFGGAA